MPTPLEEVEFLALSPNRVAVLEALMTEPATRSELAQQTGASQPTLGRILRDCTDRHWVRSEDSEYALTPTGRLVATGIIDLREILDLELGLRDLAEWLPSGALDVDLLALREATVTVPTPTRPSAPVDRVTESLATANQVRVVSHAFNERSLGAVRDRVVDGDQRFEGVFSTAAIDALAADRPLRADLRALLDADDATVYVRHEEIPVAVTVTDGTVSLLLRDDEGVLQGSIESDDDRTLDWATDVFSRYRDGAEPIDVEWLDE